jgi:hypothetical protein
MHGEVSGFTRVDLALGVVKLKSDDIAAHI